MNAKLRFTLLFSALVSIVVVLSGTTIYFLYAQIRKQVFNDRLTAQAQKVHEQYVDELEELARLRKEAVEKAVQGDSVGDYIKKIDDFI